MPATFYDQIEALQTNPEYAFDEVPMPYEITLNAKGAGSKEVVYTVTPARANTSLTDDEKAAILAAGSIRDYQAKVYEQQGESAPERTIEIEREPMPEPPPTATPGRYDSVPPEFRPKPAA
jgi:hypothetical protein